MKPLTDPVTAGANRIAFRALLSKHGVSMKAAAMGIADITQRPCAWRTVKAWLADPRRTTHHRPCPSWAVAALERWLNSCNDNMQQK